jgi:phasin family protein
MTSSNQQSSEAAMQATEWMRNMTDQILNQNKAMWEGSLSTARDAFDGVEQHSSEIRKRLLSLTESTLGNSFEFAHKVAQARSPQELLQLESEFISKQAQLFAEQSRGITESAMRGAQDAGRTTFQRAEETSRRAAKAA